MALSYNVLTQGNNSANQSNYATASITPTKGKLYIVGVLSATSPQVVPTISGAGITWQLIASDWQSSPYGISLFYGFAGDNAVAGALTIDFAGNSQANCFWGVVEITGAAYPAIVQSNHGNTNGVNAANLNISLAANANANNIILGLFCTGSSSGVTLVANSPFTQIVSQGLTENSYMCMQIYIGNSTSCQSNRSTSSNGNINGIAIEINSVRHDQFLEMF